ncbi:MAG: type III pantothenate kinase [Caldimicrobium sp.]|nr:type III pantothenate kinase [Caldimicrobium sp.]MCX7613305.1 type III pantothenate kinase [Caldimicrobium sp.]MDW8183414.1 type III pantothenate kinase [Caldimicrobium sp.]
MPNLVLAVDVGNTATTCGLFEEEGLLRALFSFKTTAVVSPEELLVRLKQFLDFYDISLRDIKGLSLACVVPPLEDHWIELGKRWLAGEVVTASVDSVKMPVDLKYPSEVGADRLVNALAGWRKYKSSLIVVDYGTAITFDCISFKGIYLGGAIAPGLYLSMESLFRGTAKLPKIDLSDTPKSVLGRDTVSALKSGLIYGFVGLTDYLVVRLSEEMESTPLVVATGGLAPLIAPLTKSIQKIDPTLTLEGLFHLWKDRFT